MLAKELKEENKPCEDESLAWLLIALVNANAEEKFKNLGKDERARKIHIRPLAGRVRLFSL